MKWSYRYYKYHVNYLQFLLLMMELILYICTTLKLFPQMLISIELFFQYITDDNPRKLEPSEYEFKNEHIDINQIPFNFKMREYTTNWTNSHFQLSDFVHSSYCSLCNFKVNPKNSLSDSKESDFTITSAFGHAHNLVPFTRTLRTVGSKCTLVIFIDNTIFDKLEFNILKFTVLCGVNLINIGEIPNMNRNLVYIERYKIYFDFIFPRRHFIDRILLIDLYDSIFQMDPFQSTWDYKTLGISDEPSPVRGGQYRGIIVLLGKERAKEFFENRNQACAGVIHGTPDQIILLCILFYKYLDSIPLYAYKRYIKTGGLDDQNIIDIMCKSEYMSMNGVKCNISYHYSTWLRQGRKIIDSNIGNITFTGENIAPIVHCFDRYGKMVRSLRKACPQEFSFFDKYIREIKM